MSNYSKAEKKEARWFYICISPWLIGFFVFSLGPLFSTIYFSLTKWNILQKPVFIGFKNFVRLFTRDDIFIKSIGNTLYYALLAIPLSLVVSLALAYLLNKDLPGIRFFRTIYYLPVLVPITAVAFVFQWIFNSDIGIVNKVLSVIGIQGPTWLYDAAWIKMVIVTMSVWQVGGMLLLVLAGIQGISPEMYESASLDGATKFQQFIKITIPLVSPVIFFNMIMSTINALQIFSESYVLTVGLFTPENSALMVNNYLYNKAFADGEMGYACAIGWVVFLMIVLLSMFVFKASRRFVFYEGNVDNNE